MKPTTAKPGPLQPVDLAGLTDDRPPAPPRFVLQELIPRREVTLFTAPGGMGKTTLALSIGQHVAAGADFCGLRVEPGRVLFASFEDEAHVTVQRMRQNCAAYGLDPVAVVENFTLLDGSDGDAALYREGSDFKSGIKPTATFNILARRAAECDLLMIDNASECFEGNENSRRDVSSFMRGLGKIARDNDAAVLLIAHVDKAAARHGGAGQSYSGSTAWPNKARSLLTLQRNNETGVIELIHEKSNFGPLHAPLPFRIGARGVPVPLTGAERDAERSEEREGVIAAFRAAAAVGETIPSKVRPGGGSAMQALATFEEYPETLRAGPGKKRATTIIQSLRSEGVLKVEAYRDAHRHQKERLILAEITSYTPEKCGSTAEEVGE